MLLKTVPTWYHQTFEDIDFKKLYDKGIRNILCDLDNTIKAFFNKDPEDKTVEMVNYLTIIIKFLSKKVAEYKILLYFCIDNH